MLVATPFTQVGRLSARSISSIHKSSSPCNVFLHQRKFMHSTVCNAEPENNQVSEQPTQSESSTPKEQIEEPIWVRRERERELMKQQGGGDLPFGVYLLASAIVAIAAVGSIFEYANKNPIFDVIGVDSPLYTPILGIFALTGLPTSGYLFYKAVSSANKEAERMDKLDGY